MTEQEFLWMLDELLEEEPGTLVGSERLVDLDAWESLTVIEFLALVDENFGVVLNPKDIAGCETIQDLLHLVTLDD